MDGAILDVSRSDLERVIWGDHTVLVSAKLPGQGSHDGSVSVPTRTQSKPQKRALINAAIDAKSVKLFIPSEWELDTTVSAENVVIAPGGSCTTACIAGSQTQVTTSLTPL